MNNNFRINKEINKPKKTKKVQMGEKRKTKNLARMRGGPKTKRNKDIVLESFL